MKIAVVGHIEWVEFVEVDHVPAPGQIAHGTDSWSEPAGGGAVAAAQILKLAGACDFFTALGDDDLGRRSVERLTELGLDLHVQWFGQTRRALVHVDRDRERTITTVGAKLLPAGPLPLDGYDGVFFVAGDVAALHSARAARFLAATPRELPTLREGAVRLDLLVGSGTDPGEHYDGSLDVGVFVATEGARGGVANGHRFEAGHASRTARGHLRRRRLVRRGALLRARPRRLAERRARAGVPGGRRRRHRKGAVHGANHSLGVDKWGVVG